MASHRPQAVTATAVARSCHPRCPTFVHSVHAIRASQRADCGGKARLTVGRGSLFSDQDAPKRAYLDGIVAKLNIPSPSAGLHIRHGDSCLQSWDPSGGRACLPLAGFMPAVRRAVKMYGVKGAFLATDDPKVSEPKAHLSLHRWWDRGSNRGDAGHSLTLQLSRPIR